MLLVSWAAELVAQCGPAEKSSASVVGQAYVIALKAQGTKAVSPNVCASSRRSNLRSLRLEPSQDGHVD
jgi:hypothetical protein